YRRYGRPCRILRRSGSISEQEWSIPIQSRQDYRLDLTLRRLGPPALSYLETTSINTGENRMKPEPLITVSSVPDSATFYCALLGARRGHEGNTYAQILLDGEMIMQLHDFNADENHAPL